MINNETILAISNMMDDKFASNLEPINRRLRQIELSIENEIKPQLQLLTKNYIPATNP